VSAAILLIMGIFTWAYLHVRAWSLEQGIRTVLADESSGLTTVNRATLQHYADFGLLTAKSYEWPESLGLYARQPEADMALMPGDNEGRVLVRFDHPADAFVPPGLQTVAEGTAIAIDMKIGYEFSGSGPGQVDLLSELGISSTQALAADAAP